MRKITGKPIFNAIQLSRIVIDRESSEGKEDGAEATIAYIHTESRSKFGSVILAQNSTVKNFSKKSIELVTQLIKSLEEDAANLIFQEPKTEESKQEGIHVQEPKGIADAEEDGSQV
jgi:hypothetical protein